MNVVLLILTIIFIFLLYNYLYRKAKGVPDKPLKEIQDELKLEWIKYKQENKEIWNRCKQEIQKIIESYTQKQNNKILIIDNTQDDLFRISISD
ncbi:hypothetical protein LZV92_07770 [Campylobacter coli]|uniref:hypothetical protein n=1 Tax=Campylobacter coli TaxID=195 RepID=UPI0023511F5E|nr:hypothetical protein [Campylobacter coli]MCE7148986.1 hypothetical protein [Campylobacter coli]MDC8054377.1 hypothetical protein [Campylobacter coli]HEB7638260.1 hypothetical protein [Campylobacter coli]HEB7651044.1 hypothetical protein [Campylobacter coli]HEB7664179.1 hypothetical protein [Campylobacter coli]